jgi:hypothetical protein
MPLKVNYIDDNGVSFEKESDAALYKLIQE